MRWHLTTVLAALAVARPLPALADAPAPGATPLAGYHDGAFYLRDGSDHVRLYVQGRAQIDAYTYFGPGVADSPLKPTFLLRRVRPELAGELFRGTVQWMLAGDWGSTALDNTKGTNETSAAAPGAAPSATSAKFASAQTATIKAAPSDVFVNLHALGPLNVQIGQFDAPFTMENRTSDKYIPFMERSIAVRGLGIPTNKELGVMAWGETSKRHFAYAVGEFLGDGQNRPNADARLDFMGRVFAHPLAMLAVPVKDLQIGASLRDGVRDSKLVNYDYAALTTQGAYAFWSPTYAGTKGTTHVIPAGNQLGLAGELRVPVSIVDWTGEIVYVNNGTREAIDGYQATNTERFGSMTGYAYYVSAGVWPLGHRDVNGLPGYENPTHLDLTKPDADPAIALQLLVKWEQLHTTYAGASRAGISDVANVDGRVLVDVLEVGVNLWATKHLRFTANYAANFFPGSAPTTATTDGGPVETSGQRALAPGNTLSTGVNDAARDHAHTLHELLFRVAVAL